MMNWVRRRGEEVKRRCITRTPISSVPLCLLASSLSSYDPKLNPPLLD